jgi:hypothetical protein
MHDSQLIFFDVKSNHLKGVNVVVYPHRPFLALILGHYDWNGS